MEKLFGLALVVLLLMSCELDIKETKYAINVDNKSPHDIGVYLALGGRDGIIYPDTILPDSDKFVIKTIKSGKRYYYDSSTPWEENYRLLPSDTLSIYVFHADTLRNNTWSVIRDKSMYLKRYDLSLDVLEEMDYTVTYP